VRTNVLDRYPSAKLDVFVVWFDMLPGDTRALTDLQVLNDRRVTNYWDEPKALGRWYGEHVTGSGRIEWDVYFLYGPDARWTDVPGPQLSSGGPVIGSSEDLGSAVRPLLGA
jgi:hypothetical protein